MHHVPAPILILLWCFAVGACVGSFLERRGLAVAAGDEPAVAGLALPEVQKADPISRQCSGAGLVAVARPLSCCHAPISSRYPLVEFATGVAFAALAYVELVRAGTNLPGVAPESSRGLLAVWLFHSLLASLLIVTALYEWDRVLVPPRLTALGLAAGLFLPFYYPGLYPTDELGDFGQPGMGFIGVLLGVAVGLFILWSSPGRAVGTEIVLAPVVVATTLAGAFLARDRCSILPLLRWPWPSLDD